MLESHDPGNSHLQFSRRPNIEDGSAKLLGVLDYAMHAKTQTKQLNAQPAR